jgi:hypothetical protein
MEIPNKIKQQIRQTGPLLIIIGLLLLFIIAMTHETERYTQALHQYYNEQLTHRNCKDQTPIQTPNLTNPITIKLPTT